MSKPITEWAVRKPASGLRPFVERFVGYRMAGHAPDVVAQTNRAQTPDRYRCVVGGLQASTALIAHDGHQEGVQIEVTPLGSRALFGMPARELWNRSLELSDVIGLAAVEMSERLHEAPTWGDRFAACERTLLALIGGARTHAALAHTCQSIVSSGGRAPIGDLATDTGYSCQHLTKRFRSEFGLTPKLAARVVRFGIAARMLQSGSPIAATAAGCGYYDQAHMHRDFAALAGCTPAGLLAEELPFFQDDLAPALA